MAAHAVGVVENATSWPAVRSASAKGTRGCQCPEPGSVVNSTRIVAPMESDIIKAAVRPPIPASEIVPTVYAAP